MSNMNKDSEVFYMGNRSYKVSYSNPAFEFFKNEYSPAPRCREDVGTYIIGNVTPPSSGFIKKLHVFVSSIFFGQDEAFSIRRGTDSFSYFALEQRNNICRDSNENIIVPNDAVTHTIEKSKKKTI